MTHTASTPASETTAHDCKLPVVKTYRDYQVYRISPDDRNRLAIVFDPKTADVSLTYCVEIFEAGGTDPFPSAQFRCGDVLRA